MRLPQGWVILVGIPLASATFSISPAGNTLTECSSVTLLWTEQPPIHLWAAPNRDINPGDPILRDFGVINDTFLLWKVDLPAGQNVSFTYVRTAAPTVLFASDQEFPVVRGTDTSCVQLASSSTVASMTMDPGLSSTVTSTIPDLSSTNGSSPHTKKSSAGTIAGGVIGGCALLMIAATGIFWIRYRHRHQKLHYVPGSEEDARISTGSGGPAIAIEPFMIPNEAQSADVTHRVHAKHLLRIRETDGGVSLSGRETLPPAYQDYSAAADSSTSPESSTMSSPERLLRHKSSIGNS